MSLLQLLACYTPYDEHEAAMVGQLRDFLSKLENLQTAFERDLVGEAPQTGHITGSAWVIDEDGARVLLAHHAKLSRWVQPGSHCDGNMDVRAVARRVAHQEAALTIAPLPASVVHSGIVTAGFAGMGAGAAGLFDIDVHAIPEYWNTPQHLHYDVCFVFKADKGTPPIPSADSHAVPSHAVRWFDLEEVAVLNNSPAIMRMIAKTRLLASQSPVTARWHS